MDPPPLRSPLLNWLDDGELEGTKLRFGWVVYETAVIKFVRKLQPAVYQESSSLELGRF